MQSATNVDQNTVYVDDRILMQFFLGLTEMCRVV